MNIKVGNLVSLSIYSKEKGYLLIVVIYAVVTPFWLVNLCYSGLGYLAATTTYSHVRDRINPEERAILKIEDYVNAL